MAVATCHMFGDNDGGGWHSANLSAGFLSGPQSLVLSIMGPCRYNAAFSHCVREHPVVGRIEFEGGAV
jgi:hypothetical protein